MTVGRFELPLSQLCFSTALWVPRQRQRGVLNIHEASLRHTAIRKLALLGCQWLRMKVDTVAAVMMGYHCRWKWKHRFLVTRGDSVRIVVLDICEYFGKSFFHKCTILTVRLLFTLDVRCLWLVHRWCFAQTRAPPAHTLQETEFTCYQLCHAFNTVLVM